MNELTDQIRAWTDQASLGENHRITATDVLDGWHPEPLLALDPTPKDRNKRRGLVGVAAILLLAAGGSWLVQSRRATSPSTGVIAVGEGSGQTSTSPLAEPTITPNDGVTITHLDPGTKLDRRVAALLPGQPEIQTVVHTESVDGRSASIQISTVADGSGYELTVYKLFAKNELDQLPTIPARAARAWLGTASQHLTSIYYLADDTHVSIRLAKLSKHASARQEPVEHLVGLAGLIARDTAVAQATAYEPTLASPRAVPNAGIVESQIPVDAQVNKAVISYLPGSPTVQQATNTKSTGSAGEYAKRHPTNNLQVSTVSNGSGFEVTIYRAFAAVEFGDAPKIAVPNGKAWIGAVDANLHSIYYLSDDQSVGLRVASVGSSGESGTPTSIKDLVRIATRIAQDKIVLQEAAAK